MAFLYYALCVFFVHFTTLRCIESQGTLPSSNLDNPPSAPVCDCGPNSKKCDFIGGKKTCKCEYRFRQVQGFCEPFCEEEYECDNGARCVDESCVCLPGTRGDFCEIVDECEGLKGAWKCGDPSKINCLYDSKIQKAACSCSIYEYAYDESKRKCVECDCNPKYGSCSLVNGVKTCKCNPGTALKKERGNLDRCSPCDCGNNSNGCSFQDLSGNGIYWTQVCDCKDGYYQQNAEGLSCEKCECGPHGKCKANGFYLSCECDEGYKSFLTKDRNNITCKECDCGRNGVCSFKEEVKKCECDKNYAERNGKCTACQCYANDKPVDCYFEGKTQHCLCPEGYENGTVFCKDINECSRVPDECPQNTYCVNTEGSFECPCVEGYEPREGRDPKIAGCEDIDECEIESMCPRVHTSCDNLPGTYECECEWGYEPVTPHESPVAAGCQLTGQPTSATHASPWQTTVIIIGVIVGLCIVGVVIAICMKRRSHEPLPQTDTALQRMK